LVGYKSTLNGLSRIKANEQKITEDLNSDWSILTEAVQIILRREKIEDAYTLVKNLVRGKKLSEKDFRKLISELNVSEKVRSELQKLTPSNYLGLAKKLTDKALK
jgi:adenylosuccinate lyase